MAYTVIPAGDIVAGKPTKEEIFDQIRTNQEHFNTEITALQGTSQVNIMSFKVSGYLNDYTVAQINERMPVYKAPVAAQMTSFVVTLLSASSSGTLSIDLEKSTDNGASWSGLLSSDVTMTGTTVGSVSGTVNWVDVPSQSFAQNDLIRIQISGLQSGQGDFLVSLYGEVS